MSIEQWIAAAGLALPLLVGLAGVILEMRGSILQEDSKEEDKEHRDYMSFLALVRHREMLAQEQTELKEEAGRRAWMQDLLRQERTIREEQEEQ